MKIKRCSECGFAYWLAKLIKWNDNGTITSTLQPDFRTLIIEADYLSEIFKSIEEALGVSIEHIVYEAQRNASKIVLDIALARFRWLLRHIPGLTHLAIRYMNRMASWTGQSYAKSLCYKTRGPGEAIIRNPFNRNLMAAVVIGALESLGEIPYTYTWNKLGDDDIISVEPSSKHSKICERLTFTTPSPKPGNRHYDHCPKCGVPVLLRDLEWRENEGMIIDTRSNVRVVVLEIYTTDVVLRELAKELGEDIYPIIVDAQRRFSLQYIPKEFPTVVRRGEQTDKDGIYNSVFDRMALFGQGNPVSCVSSDGKLSITVENPFSEHILAGYFSALYELVEGHTPKMDWHFTDPSTVLFELTA